MGKWPHNQYNQIMGNVIRAPDGREGGGCFTSVDAGSTSTLNTFEALDPATK